MFQFETQGELGEVCVGSVKVLQMNKRITLEGGVTESEQNGKQSQTYLELGLLIFFALCGFLPIFKLENMTREA